MMTNETYFTYYSFNHSLVLEYVNAAVSVTFFIIKNAENFRKTIIITDGKTKSYIISHYLVTHILPNEH